MSYDSLKQKISTAKSVIEQNLKAREAQRLLDEKIRQEKEEKERLKRILTIISESQLEARIDSAIQYGITKFTVIDDIPSSEWEHLDIGAKIKKDGVYLDVIKYLIDLGLTVTLYKSGHTDQWGDRVYQVSMHAEFPAVSPPSQN